MRWRVIEMEWRNSDAVTLVFENPVTTRPCVNGEIFVHRDPLLYALPLPEEKKVLKKSRGGVKEFHEWELRPADPRSLAELFLDPSLPGAGFRVRENPRYNRALPWAEPAFSLWANSTPANPPRCAPWVPPSSAAPPFPR